MVTHPHKRAGHISTGISRVELIGFEEVTPEPMPFPRLWHGIGKDHDAMIYVAIGNGQEKQGEPGDVLIFQYDPVTENKRFLKSVRQILADDNNLGPNEHWPMDESVPKVHSDMIAYNGKMYFSTHTWEALRFKESHRGGHFLCLDLADGTFEDLSKTDSLGVSVVSDGIIGMNILRKRRALVGWTSPHGRLLIYDLQNRRTKDFGRGLPEGIWTNTARVVIACESGGVYASYSKDENVPGNDRLYKLNWDAERLEATDQLIPSRGRFEGIAETSDEGTIFLADTDGTLYAFDAEREKLHHLGSMLTFDRTARGEEVRWLYNMAMSPDEKKLFTIPHGVSAGNGDYHLYEYDIATETRTDLGDFSQDLAGCVPTGNGVFDDAQRYYISFYCEKEKRAGILRIDVSDRVEPTSAAPVISPPGGQIIASTMVNISTRTPGARIRYTMDGTEPTVASPQYNKPITVEGGSVVKARTYKDGLHRSQVARAYFF